MAQQSTAGDASVPRRIAGYEIESELGEYQGTRRYRALQIALGRRVVLNVLPAEAARRATCAALFERRMNVCATLRHENVVGAIEAGEYEGGRYFVVELVEGATLRDALADGATFELGRALRIARDVGRALVHLEALRLVHREISPRTIAVDETGAARVVDFRRTKFVAPDGAETWSDASLGLALYSAPEVALGRRGVDHRADVYSLGAVLYHLATGRPPFYAKNVAIVLDALRTKRPRDPRWLNPAVPADVARVLDRCLRKKPEERYPTAVALCADLEALVAGRPPAPDRTPGSAWARPKDGAA